MRDAEVACRCEVAGEGQKIGFSPRAEKASTLAMTSRTVYQRRMRYQLIL
jgi:hypothetical protein